MVEPTAETLVHVSPVHADEVDRAIARDTSPRRQAYL